MMEMSKDNHLDKILTNPLTTNVFIHLRLQQRPQGVREIQRALKLGSPSSVHWHLNKLTQLGIVEQLQGNKYQVVEPYSSIKKIPLTVSIDHYVIRGKAVPGVFLLFTFLSITIGAIFFMILLNLWLYATFTGFFSLIITLILIIKFYVQVKRKSNKNKED
ncbi:MAG: winged helix-turn-helix domain-containing protein [Candidatus Hodarchaeales archaeon]